MSQPIKLIHWAFEVTGCRECTNLNKVCPTHEAQRERVESEVERLNAAYAAGYESCRKLIAPQRKTKFKLHGPLEGRLF